MDELKAKCKQYYGKTETKEVGDGQFLYRTVPQTGIRMLSLGYFDTELDAVTALYTYLVNNNLV